METKEIDLDFLENIVAKGKSADYFHKAGWGNIEQIADNVLSFTEFNFLHGGQPEIKFDGHYNFYVNIENFDYVVSKYANYGSLAYVNEIAEKSYFLPHESIKNAIEALIADKLIGSYNYDSTHINHKGANLFGTTVKDSFGNYPGYKRSLITDYRHYNPENKPNELGYLSPIDLEIINLLNDKKAYKHFSIK